MQQHGSISKASCSEKEARHQRLHTTLFYFYNILGKGTITETKTELVHGQQGGMGNSGMMSATIAKKKSIFILLEKVLDYFSSIRQLQLS